MGLENLMLQTESLFVPDPFNMELEHVVASCEAFRDKEDHPIEFPASSTDASPYATLFDTCERSESLPSEALPQETPQGSMKPTSCKSIDPATVQEIKQSMAGTSRLIGTFTLLRSTYLKLCKEFNYLLGKFNENERIKIELIHENNQLRELLFDSIKEKELNRKKYCADLKALKAAGCPHRCGS